MPARSVHATFFLSNARNLLIFHQSSKNSKFEKMEKLRENEKVATWECGGSLPWSIKFGPVRVLTVDFDSFACWAFHVILSNAQQSCVPATALGVWLFVNRMRSENIELWCSRDRKYWIFVLWGQKILMFGAPGTKNIDFWCSGIENIDFWWSGDRKYWFFNAPGIENIDFWCSGDRKYWFWHSGIENIDFWCSGDKKYWFLVLQG